MSADSSAKQVITALLKKADIRVNGRRPQDIQIHDDRTYARVLKQGTLGVGESYMDGWWDSPDLLQLITL